MAYSVTYTRPADGGNHSMKTEVGVEYSFTRTAGTIPPVSAVVTSVQVTFSSIKVWSNQTPTMSIGSMGMFPLSYTGDSAESQSAYLTSLNAGAALSFAINGGGLVLTPHTSGGSSGAEIGSIRSACAISITVVYDVTSASTGTLSSTTVMLGRGITITIDPADPAFTHVLFWQSAAGISESSSVNLAAGVDTYTFTVPSNWTTGQARVYLWTKNNGDFVGQNVYYFTITVDGSQVFPSTGSLSITRIRSQYVPSGWTGYVQGLDRATVALPNASAGNQATLQQVALACGSQRQVTASSLSFTTDPLDETGSVRCTGSVTNSFGNSNDATPVSITVHPYGDPQISKVQAYRCVSASDSTPDDNGAYIAVKAQATISSVDNQNALVSLTAQYKKSTDPTPWERITGYAINHSGAITIIGGDVTGTDTYEVRIVAIDTIQNLKNTYSSKIVIALIADSIIHILNGGMNVSFGMEGSRQNAIEITEDWDIYHGSVKLNGTVPIERGGTGSITAATARSALGVTPANIGAADASHTHGPSDITGQIPVNKGGTGADNAASARSNLGAAAETHNHTASDVNAGTLAAARLPFKYAYGKVQINQTWTTVALPTTNGFTSDPVVLCTYTDDAASSGINVIKTRNVSTVSFEVCTAGSSNTMRYICWLAFGV